MRIVLWLSGILVAFWAGIFLMLMAPALRLELADIKLRRLYSLHEIVGDVEGQEKVERRGKDLIRDRFPNRSSLGDAANDLRRAGFKCEANRFDAAVLMCGYEYMEYEPRFFALLPALNVGWYIYLTHQEQLVVETNVRLRIWML